MPLLPVTPIKNLEIISCQIPAFKKIPNTSIQNIPLLIYYSCFPSDATASKIESDLEEIGEVFSLWRYKMHPETHFHSTTHKVLCVTAGEATICFGGEDNPERAEILVEPGDVMIVPAGVGHNIIHEHDRDFKMIGAYPKSEECWDICSGEEGEEEKVRAISRVPWFERDPIYGDYGPAVDLESV